MIQSSFISVEQGSTKVTYDIDSNALIRFNNKIFKNNEYSKYIILSSDSGKIAKKTTLKHIKKDSSNNVLSATFSISVDKDECNGWAFNGLFLHNQDNDINNLDYFDIEPLTKKAGLKLKICISIYLKIDLDKSLLIENSKSLELNPLVSFLLGIKSFSGDLVFKTYDSNLNNTKTDLDYDSSTAKNMYSCNYTFYNDSLNIKINNNIDVYGLGVFFLNDIPILQYNACNLVDSQINTECVCNDVYNLNLKSVGISELEFVLKKNGGLVSVFSYFKTPLSFVKTLNNSLDFNYLFDSDILVDDYNTNVALKMPKNTYIFGEKNSSMDLLCNIECEDKDVFLVGFNNVVVDSGDKFYLYNALSPIERVEFIKKENSKGSYKLIGSFLYYFTSKDNSVFVYKTSLETKQTILENTYEFENSFKIFSCIRGVFVLQGQNNLKLISPFYSDSVFQNYYKKYFGLGMGEPVILDIKGGLIYLSFSKDLDTYYIASWHNFTIDVLGAGAKLHYYNGTYACYSVGVNRYFMFFDRQSNGFIKMNASKLNIKSESDMIGISFAIVGDYFLIIDKNKKFNVFYIDKFRSSIESFSFENKAVYNVIGKKITSDSININGLEISFF